MIHTFQLEIVSPEALVFSKEVVMVTCPGAEGDFGVLAGHMPFISTLRPGLVHVYEHDDKTFESLFVAGGFAEVTNTRCTVLAEQVLALSGISTARAQAALEAGEKALKKAVNDTARKIAEQQIAVANAMFEAVKA